MRIRDFSLELARPLETAKGSISERTGFLVAVEHEGTLGVGEATPLPGWTESLEDCRVALDSVSDPGSALGDGSLDDTPAARHAVSLALTDATARAENESLATSLATKSHTSLPVNATIGDGDIETTVTDAETAVSVGFDCLKVKVGARDPTDDIERLRAVRDAVGSDISIRADVNGAWDRWTADEFLSGVADFDLEYLEQPLPADEIAGHAVLRRLHDTPLALDESLAHVSPERALASNAADVLVCKPMALGGPDHVLSVAKQAARSNVDVVVTTTIDAVVARLGALHVAAALPSTRAHGLATASLLQGDLAAEPVPVVDGSMTVPDAPGLGIDVDDLF
ncbi:mandelate racemase/muconate lactonizing enzyme family protein [Haloferax sp. DFSO60]|uniref:mandelate racemase/muconate lactonizing enzyme family protein n=1 Tax=Haloferax sp. DFSO60 TaxID=3388652 RepID=UPI003978C853